MHLLKALIFLGLTTCLCAQQPLKLSWGPDAFVLDKTFKINDSTQIKLTQFKFYLVAKNQYTKPSIFLVDAADTNLFSLQNSVATIQLGIDPELQMASDFKGALDPINGMYWTWNSGYIQLKCTGDLISMATKQEKHFELHLGGMQAPWICMYPLSGTGHEIVFDVAIWLTSIYQNQSGIPTIMQPSAMSVAIFNFVKEAFYYAR
jgi:hypothetical protein